MSSPPDQSNTRKILPRAAQRALAEAETRRLAERETSPDNKVEPEVGGRKGPDPIRYGDWENKGIVSDF